MALPATDNFNRANGGLGANWTTVSTMAAPLISGNLVQTNLVSQDSAAFWNADTFPNDQRSQVIATKAITDTGKSVFAAVRVAAATKDFYAAGARGPLGASATLEIRKFISGTSTVLSTATKTINAGDLIMCEVIGNTLNAYVNGVLQGTVASGGQLLTGSAGIFIFVDTGADTDAQLDDWQGGGIPTADAAVASLSPTISRFVLSGTGG